MFTNVSADLTEATYHTETLVGATQWVWLYHGTISAHPP